MGLPAPTSTMKMFVVLALAAAAVAEPEAAADAQLISAYGAYGAYPYTTTYGAPSYTRSYGVYGGAYSSPLMSALSFSHIGKREAEADPALVYSNAYPYTTTYAAAAYPYSHVAPMTTTYNNIVASPVTYTAHVATPLASNGAHAVAATTAGWTHSANVGVCTNVHGQQVAC